MTDTEPTTVLTALQTEFVRLRCEGLSAPQALREMALWRASALNALRAVPGTWPTFVRAEVERLVIGLNQLEAAARGAVEAAKESKA